MPSALYIEDNELDLASVRLALKGQCEIEPSKNVSMAEKQLKSRTFDYLIADINLGSEETHELIFRWESLIPIIILTGDGTQKSRKTFKNHNILAYLVKDPMLNYINLLRNIILSSELQSPQPLHPR